jgi:hypothetical protein
MLVALGLLILHWSSSSVRKAKDTLLSPSRWASTVDYDWEPPFKAWTSAVWFFLAANVFLAVVPLVPPQEGKGVYENLPYWVRGYCISTKRVVTHEMFVSYTSFMCLSVSW